jgi:chromatin modification-related protein EAF6
MTENVPPAPNNAGGTAANGAMDQTQNRGIPYYEKLRRDLRDALQKKRLMDKSMVSLGRFI